MKFVRGGKYNWINQPEVMIYLGQDRNWYQFALEEDPKVIWCEILEGNVDQIELNSIEPELKMHRKEAQQYLRRLVALEAELRWSGNIASAKSISNIQANLHQNIRLFDAAIADLGK